MSMPIITKPKKSSRLLLTLFAPNHPDALHTPDDLQRIRDRIYFFVWNTRRADYYHGDFVIEYHGVRRNVVSRHCPKIVRRDKFEQKYGDTSLLYVNKAISEDFARYIYGVSTVEIYVEAFVYGHRYDFTNTNVDVEGRGKQFQHQIRTNKRLLGLYAKNFMITVAFKKLAKKTKIRVYSFNDSAECLCNIMNEWFENDKTESIEIVVNGSGEQVSTEEINEATRPFCGLKFTDWQVYSRGVSNWRKRPVQVDASQIKGCSKTWAKMLVEKHKRLLAKQDLTILDDDSEDGAVVFTPAATAVSEANSDLIDLQSIA